MSFIPEEAVLYDMLCMMCKQMCMHFPGNNSPVAISKLMVNELCKHQLACFTVILLKRR